MILLDLSTVKKLPLYLPEAAAGGWMSHDRQTDFLPSPRGSVKQEVCRLTRTEDLSLHRRL